MNEIPNSKILVHCFASRASQFAWMGVLALLLWVPGLGYGQERLGTSSSPYFGGEKLFHAGKYEDARAVFQEFLEHHPEWIMRTREGKETARAEARAGDFRERAEC